MLFRQLVHLIQQYTFYIICLCLFISPFNAFGKANLDFKHIPILFNTDSMEKMIPSMNKLSTEYVDHLITLEQSRFDVSSAKFGKHANEIDSISKQLNYQFGIACGSYFKSARNISVSPNYVRSTIEFAENALQLFEKLHDEDGIFYSKIVLITSYIYNLRSVDFIENSVNDIQSCKRIRRKYTENKYRYLYENFNFAQKQSSSKYIVRCIRLLIIAYYFSTDDFLKKNTDFNKLKNLAFSSLNLIRKDEKLKYLHASQYNVVCYILNDREAINNLKIALQEDCHPESIQNAVIAKHISQRYYFLNRHSYRDSIIYYIKSELKIISEHDSVPYKYFHHSHSMISDLQTEKSEFYEAIMYKIKAYDMLLKHNEHFENILANSYLEFENFKLQKLENEKITARKNNIDQNFKLSALFIFFLLLLIIILIRNYQSMKNAKTEIEKLQLARDKFYSILVHDIQSPIKSYQGLAARISYLIRKNDFAEIAAIATKIDETGIQMNNMFQNLLQKSSSQANKLSYTLQLFKIEDCLRDLLIIYHPLTEQNKISIIQDIQFHDYVKTDQNYLSTVLRNLIDNAIKHSLSNSNIELELYALNDVIHFSIKNKCKLSNEKFQTIQHLFASTKNWEHGEQGLGLGLILIKDYTEKMGGKINVKMEDEMICFVLTIPNQ